jgi:hypothetical protein
MPTKKSKPSATLKSSLASLEAQRGASNAETVADYGVAASAVKAGTAGLAKQMSRIQAVTAGVDRRTVRGVAKLSDKARAIQRRTIAEQNRISNNYGGAYGGVAALEFYGARARAGAGARSAEANVRLGVDQAKAGQLAAGIASQGVAAGQAAAQYALAQAMQSRFMVTNDTIASLEGQLQQTALQYNLQLRNAKAEQKMAEDKAGTESKAAVKGLIEQGSELATSVGRWVAEYKADPANANAPFEKANATTLAQQWAARTGYTDDAHIALFVAAIRRMQQGVNAGPAFRSAFTEVYGGMKGFDQWGEPMLRSIESNLGANYLASQVPEPTRNMTPEQAAGTLSGGPQGIYVEGKGFVPGPAQQQAAPAGPVVYGK